ncbi:aromatic ring-hydroxylating dioxygenase subunit alpha [Xanthobacter dioxanivorans]|uniref:Aromatic ring-hydroxylating dioxygenase subunit alpha n=1 Tax=Xanthobacter dioxanivorans TaxID=2528964 RepID=A0A974SKM9_9HYPH|nr:aromatic ring-hydroxylating dioxygenase subunit alpha [Xanthobacter dioxanivorans]QRG08394.1 aromatic ring-hydroxylating dioxygenase subunit alpha [Xanthobacter dioxanivorans]
MEFLWNTWHFAAWAQDVAAGQLVPRILLNVPVVLFRDAAGQVAAMEDRCPHRFAPLSRGRLAGDRVICGYHGLEFDARGACVRNPHLSGKVPAAAKVRTFPVVERHSGLWIWLGEEIPDSTLIPDYSILSEAAPEAVTRRDHFVMNVPFELIVDNILDCSHGNFLHRDILGNEEMNCTDTTVEQVGNAFWVRRFMANVPCPGIWDLMFRGDGGTVDTWQDCRWEAPSALLLDVGVTEAGAPRRDGTGYLGLHIMTPQTKTSTHYHTVAVRWNISPSSETEETRAKISDLRKFAFVEQDEPMISAQHEIMLMTGAETLGEVLLETDVGVVRWRKIMSDLLSAEQAGRARNTRLHRTA